MMPSSANSIHTAEELDKMIEETRMACITV